MSDATDEYGGISAATANAVTLERDQLCNAAEQPCARTCVSTLA